MSYAELVRRRFTPDEYLTIERNADFKSQYLDGEIYAMAGGTTEHNAISANVIIAIGVQLRGGPCRTFTSDQKVRTSPEGLFSYPDVTVVCGEVRYHNEHRDVLTNPTMIVEVLSRTTEVFDRGLKFDKYREIATLTDYLLIAQDEPHVELFTRQPDGDWSRTTATGLDDSLPLPSLNTVLRLSEVYEKIPGIAEQPSG